MSNAKRSWAGRAAVAAMALALIANAALAAMAAPEVDKLIVPSVASLVRFYPTQLSSTPSGTVEDQEVWLAKVQGLAAGAPSLLQQSLLMSQNKREFLSNVALLQQMQKGLLEQNALNMRSQARSGQPGLKALGDSNNLVYKALEPCRIMDTRFASGASGVQGPIAGGSLKSIPDFIPAGTDWSAYGQTAPLSDCGLTNGLVGSNAFAVALVVTILNPNFDAFLGISDINNLNTTLSHVALNFTRNQGLSTLYILTQNFSTIYFAMPAGLSANIIFDVVGYFITSDATALQCVTMETTISQPNGFNNYFSSPACPAGYTLTGGGAEFVGSFPVDWYKNGPATNSNLETQWTAGQRNVSGSTNTGHVYGRCCRIPGK